MCIRYDISQVETLAEGLVFAEKTGLGTTNLHKFIESVMGGPFTAYSKRMAEGSYMTDEPLFSVPLATKDAMHAINLAAASGAPGILKVTQAIVDHMKKVPEVSGKKADNADFAAVYGVVRTEAGLEFDNGSLGGRSGVGLGDSSGVACGLGLLAKTPPPKKKLDFSRYFGHVFCVCGTHTELGKPQPINFVIS
ncbi:hypothetical protein BGX38DRAFT_726478 [Terfezia claveryi]|nr:hypothetical protein BGX38DRAFT_726478 [Terfezia claveryi]